VTDDLVDGGEDGLRIAVVPQVGRNGALNIDDVVVANPVERSGAYSRRHGRLDHAENFCGKLGGAPRQVELIGGPDGNDSSH
jgi:hypothetical protein